MAQLIAPRKKRQKPKRSTKRHRGCRERSEKASKYLAPFDELNTISGNDAGGGSESGGNAVNFDSDIGSGVNAVMALMTGIALLAIGAILTFPAMLG